MTPVNYRPEVVGKNRAVYALTELEEGAIG